MTFYEQMVPALSALLKTGEILETPIYGTLIRKGDHAFGYFGLTNTAILVALLQGSSKKLGLSGRIPLNSIQRTNVRKRLFLPVYILRLELAEGIVIKIQASKKVIGFDTQGKNLDTFLSCFQQ